MTIAIKRTSPRYLAVSGVTCGLTVAGTRCGGELTVRDYNDLDEFRYELYCERCGRCDPNGHGTPDEALRAVGKFFHGGEK